MKLWSAPSVNAGMPLFAVWELAGIGSIGDD